MTKYYRVKKPTFIWNEGAILSDEEVDNGYTAIEDCWDACDEVGGEYISKRIIEAQPEWFERVYPDPTTPKQFLAKEKIVQGYQVGFPTVKR